MNRDMFIDTEELDGKDVTIIKMGITIIALVCALVFSLYSNINLSATIVESLPIMWQLILATIIFIVMFSCLYSTWYFSLGTQREKTL